MKNLLFIIMLFFSTSQLTMAAPGISLDAGQKEALGIRTSAAQPVKRAWGGAYPASVRVPNSQLMVITAPQEGLITHLEVAEGEAVKQNQLLAVIQSPRLVEEQRLYLEATSRLGLSRASLNRDRQLKAEGIIAERRFLETQAQYTQARTEVEQRRQALLLAGMDEPAIRRLEKQHKLSSTLEVRSPMAGMILEQLAMPGQRVEIASPIYRIGQLDPLWLEIQVPLESLDGLKPGDAVKLDKPDREGHIITIGSMIHGENQSVLVRAEVTNADQALRPGQFVQARLASPGGRSAWRVPQQAVLRVNGRTWVLVQKNAGFQPLEISIVTEEPDALVIEGRLQPGDQVAVSGTAALKAIWLEGEG
jgi:RND family efflux transporter MFP subunit